MARELAQSGTTTAVQADAVAASTVDVRVLGPVELLIRCASGVRPVPLGGPRQRALFGLLALRTPAIVAVPALIDGLWGDHPPATAVKTLHAHVAYLRRALGAVGRRELIGTRAPGYALRTDAGHVDAYRFEELSRRGRAALAAGSADQAAALLGEALRLWRGDPLSDCPVGEWVRAEATRLEAARLQVAEEYYTAELGRGRHGSVVADLAAMTARHPLRERPWELLMIAQYRCGRQGDALDAYRRARAALVSELGVEPGRTLRGLEQAILRGDHGRLAAALAPPAPPTTRPAAGQPQSVPSEFGPSEFGPSEFGPSGFGPSRSGSWRSGSAEFGSQSGPPEFASLAQGQTVGEGDPVAPVPVPITALIGRQRELAELSGLLADRRLVTLTGLGGAGKTRIAIAVAERLATRYPDGVRFVDLTPVTEPDSLPAAVATTLGVPVRAGADPADTLLRRLRPVETLLVLDNCEHLADAGAALVETLLGRCPGLRVLATGRQALGVPGEVEWPVRPLPVPPTAGDRRRGDRQPGSLAELTRYDSVRLFLERAAVAAVRDLTDADAPALAAICAGLDGLPLAIELAAARTGVLTVPEIAARIRDPELLRAGGRPARHRALRDTMAWSYGLLGPAARSRFRRLAVFVGGFTLPAVRAVWADDAESPVESLAGLVGRSLVVMERRPAGARYRLLETLRQYAAERLADDPAEEATARRDHAVHYAELTREVDRDLHGPSLERLLDRLAVEHDNLRTALAWFAAHRPGSEELRFAAALARYCHLRGRYAEGRRWLGDAIGRYAGPPAPELADALTGAARLAFFACDYPVASGYGERALAAYRELVDRRGAARTLRLLGSIARERGEYDRSSDRYAAAMTAFAEAGDEAGSALTAQLAGFTHWLTGDLDRADDLLDRAATWYRRADDPEGIASARVHQAAVAFYRDEPARARWLAGDALDRFRRLDFDEGVAWALNILGLVEQCDGAPGTAVGALRGSLEIHCAVGDRWRAASVLEALAAVLVDGADPAAAAELLGAADAIRVSIGAPVPPRERPARDAARARLAEVLPDRDRYAAQARGEALRFEDLPARLPDLVPGTPTPAAARPARPPRALPDANVSADAPPVPADALAVPAGSG
ncbi:BTAD domain-containing putative transcriptional regulator [Solwaraspora sp. WMMD1047]|uniref:AfsR/SARP family transcriptional regulator n=1 Tax=Solwaraspora sp. WMMD1047 TaxID=3016102 RepID=UPI002416987B|nr:BTAD domain-containing putative transcriptional regulator [Solwaraspora sp. WMMD1047]MDG4831498.1 BTAD domain-containing putative transcriptional regulator [Solwaraspora sp. WMMD1047]